MTGEVILLLTASSAVACLVEAGARNQDIDRRLHVCRCGRCTLEGVHVCEDCYWSEVPSP